MRSTAPPVLPLWGFVVAQRLGYSHDSALSLAKAIAGMSALAKAKSLGLAEDRDTDLGKRTKAREAKEQAVTFMGRRVSQMVAEGLQGFFAADRMSQMVGAPARREF